MQTSSISGSTKVTSGAALTSLREFVAALEAEGRLIHVDRAVSPCFEIAAFIRKSLDEAGHGLHFDSVDGHPGWNVYGCLYGSLDAIALGLGCAKDEIVSRYQSAIQNPIPPRIVEAGACQDVVQQGDEVDLRRLPVVTHSAKDGGPFVTSAVDVVTDPDTGVRGLGIHRHQLFGRNRLGHQSGGERRVYRAFQRAEARGESLEIAIAIGCGPAVDLASVASVPHDVDKYGIAGALAGRPVDLVKCVSIDVEVPADSEIVLEGRFLAGQRELEGPFGDRGGTYGTVEPRPVIEISAVTMRRDAVYQTVLTGLAMTENDWMCWPRDELYLKELLAQAAPGIVDYARYQRLLVVSMRKHLQHEARNVALSLFSHISGAPKYCIVVDEDIDVHNLQEVIWALSNRAQPDGDCLILPSMAGVPLDPSSPVYRHSSRLAVDATVPLGEDAVRFERVHVPGVEEISLQTGRS